AGVAPVALGLEIAEAQLLGQPELDLRRRVRDLAGDELQAAARPLVIEQNARAGEQAVTLAEIHGNVVAVRFGNGVRAAWMKRRRFALRSLTDLAEHLAAGGLIETRLR